MTSGEHGLIAEVFPVGLTERELTTGPAKPGHSHPLADALEVCMAAHSHDFTDDFMPRHPGQHRLRQFTVYQM